MTWRKWFWAVWFLIVLPFVITSCTAFQKGVNSPIATSIDQIAQQLCAAYESAAIGQSIGSEAVKTFCAVADNWQPFVKIVDGIQQDARAKVPLKTAALPSRCAPAPAGSSVVPLPITPAKKK